MQSDSGADYDASTDSFAFLQPASDFITHSRSIATAHSTAYRHTHYRSYSTAYRPTDDAAHTSAVTTALSAANAPADALTYAPAHLIALARANYATDTEANPHTHGNLCANCT